MRKTAKKCKIFQLILGSVKVIVSGLLGEGRQTEEEFVFILFFLLPESLILKLYMKTYPNTNGKGNYCKFFHEVNLPLSRTLQ